MGELRKRGNVWWIRYYRNGRRFEESSKSAKKGVPGDLLKLREGDCAKGLPVSSAMGRLRFETAAEAVVQDYTMNGRDTTEHVKRRIKKHLGPYFNGRRMTAITTDVITAYVVERQQPGASNAEINRELGILKRAFRLAMQAGKLMVRPHIPMLESATRGAVSSRRSSSPP
jgi:hypothetical protein